MLKSEYEKAKQFFIKNLRESCTYPLMQKCMIIKDKISDPIICNKLALADNREKIR
jgi:hypothetical protein